VQEVGEAGTDGGERELLLHPLARALAHRPRASLIVDEPSLLERHAEPGEKVLDRVAPREQRDRRTDRAIRGAVMQAA
jgi:hypothetical protein